jgi:hypothetical protein
MQMSRLQGLVVRACPLCALVPPHPPPLCSMPSHSRHTFQRCSLQKRRNTDQRAAVQACHLEAVTVSGYWRLPAAPPGARLAVHNHCWSAVKLEGRWRLLDATAAAAARGHAPFFVAPEQFRVTHLPLNAPWSLTRDYMAKDAFFAQPWLSCAFLSKGGRLLSHGIEAVTALPAPAAGGPLPIAALEFAVPPGYRCAACQPLVVHRVAERCCFHHIVSHSLRAQHAAYNNTCLLHYTRFAAQRQSWHTIGSRVKVCLTFAPRCRLAHRVLDSAGALLYDPALPPWAYHATARAACGHAYQDEVPGAAGATPVATPGGALACRRARVAVALPAPGRYVHVVYLVRDVKDAVAVEVVGGPRLELVLEERELALRIAVRARRGAAACCGTRAAGMMVFLCACDACRL